VSGLSVRDSRRIIERRRQKLERRLRRIQWEDQPQPMLNGSNIHYEVSEKVKAINCGGIGAIHKMVQWSGLVTTLNANLKLLKFHVPYHESDHILNIAYNILSGGKRLEDIELNRNNEAYMNALGAQRIPDPTTAGDFTRRFSAEDNNTLMDCVNETRKEFWRITKNDNLKEALIDVDGTIAPTYGQCKEGMDISYKGIWGYAPLLITLANTKEVLYLVNRSGNVTSHDGAAEWIDRAIELVKPFSEKICVRGDTDFSLTLNFDKWSDKVDFVFGMDACPGFVRRAQLLPQEEWAVLKRAAKYKVKTEKRGKPTRVKEQIVRERAFKNIRLASEHVAEFDYRPTKCKKTYRMVVVRKNLSVEKGELMLFDDVKYFFYITTRRDLSALEVVKLANKRCDQENVIEQLKNGVNAMRMPVRDLNSNWAYMIIAALAWNLKAWYGLLMPDVIRGTQVLKMEFRSFLHKLILVPCQIIKRGRKIIYRFLGYNDWLTDFFNTWELIRQLKNT
jgi:hypothetical protein